MKRAAYLIPKIIDLNNLYLAYHKAAKAKKNKAEVVGYGKNLNNNLKLLQKQIENTDIDIGHYHYFTIYDPKKRTICAASFPERVLHHAIMNVCHQYFECFQIYDSYATRVGKGTYKAIDRAVYYNRRYKYYLKMDIRKYFDNISHTILLNQLKKLFKDKDLLTLFNKIIDSYKVNEGYGVPIGNLTSQYFANNYLADFDHFVKEKLKIKAYVRYMDDMVVWASTSNEIKHIYGQIEQYLTDKLYLELKPPIINTSNHGLSFLSYRIFKTHKELQQKSKARFLSKIEKYYVNLAGGYWTQENFAGHVEPLISFTQHASAKGFRKIVFEKFRE